MRSSRIFFVDKEKYIVQSWFVMMLAMAVLLSPIFLGV